MVSLVWIIIGPVKSAMCFGHFVAACCLDVPGEKRIRSAIDTLVEKGLFQVAEAQNPHHNKFYKEDAGSGFGVPEARFFGVARGLAVARPAGATA